MCALAVIAFCNTLIALILLTLLVRKSVEAAKWREALWEQRRRTDAFLIAIEPTLRSDDEQNKWIEGWTNHLYHNKPRPPDPPILAAARG